MKQTKKNSVSHLAVFVALLWLLASAEVASAQIKVNIVHPGAVGAAAVPLPIAHEQGLFAKHGIETKLVFRPGAGTARLTEEDPFGYIGAPFALQQAMRGTKLKILASVTTGRLSNHLVARPDIRKPEELRGKRFGVLGLGTGIWINTVLALEHLGLDPKRDNISILEVGNLPQMAQALEAGRIDAAVLSPAQSSQLKQKDFTVLLDLYQANLYGPQNAVAVTESYLRQYPDVVEKVVAAMVESLAFSLSPKNKSTVLKTIMKEFNISEPAAAEEGFQQFFHTVNRKPYPTVDRLKNMQRVMALHDPEMLKLKVEDVIEDRFVRKLDESGVIDRLYSTYEVK